MLPDDEIINFELLSICTKVTTTDDLFNAFIRGTLFLKLAL